MTKKSKKAFLLCQRCKLDSSMVLPQAIMVFWISGNDGPFCWFCFDKLCEKSPSARKKLPYNYRIRELLKQADKKEVDLMKLHEEGKIPFDIFEIIGRIK